MKTIYSLLGITTMLALTASVVGAQDSHKTPEKKAAKKTSTAAKGAVVAVDPKTGQMRTPTPEEMQALGHSNRAGSTAASRNRSGTAAGSEMQEIHHHTGAEGVVLDESYMTSMVATVGADGKVSYKCIDGSKDGSNAKASPTGMQMKKGGAADVQ